MNLAWTKSIVTCPNIVYTLSDGANAPITQAFITLGVNKFTINPPVTIADVNTYNFKVHGVIGTNPVYTNNEVSFTVTITNQCGSSVLTTSAISPISYDILSGSPLDVPYTWTRTPTVCPDLTFTLTDNSNVVVTPSYLTLGTNKLTISASSISDVGTYNYKLVGSIGTNPVYKSTSVSFSITITNQCASVTITSFPFTDVTYDITETTPSIITLTWTPSLSTCGSITYQLLDSSNNPISY